MAESVIYCDGASDEIAAERFLLRGSLADARVERLPALSKAPPELVPLLAWERIDWVIVNDGELRCTVELSRHGYTGDHGFQRFARLFRSASLGIPTVYFTAFSRTRLNEIDANEGSPRNVPPELFETLAELESQFGVPCLAVDWPVLPEDGQPAPLDDPLAVPAVTRLAELICAITEFPPDRAAAIVGESFADLVAAMRRHAEIPYRGGGTRGEVTLPIEVGSPAWIYDFLPDDYFREGKAEKSLASLALDSCSARRCGGADDGLDWTSEHGMAWVQYLGYQWRSDPSCGLIALSATKARARGIPLIVVWPRVFSSAGGKRLEMLAALEEFKTSRSGPLVDEMRRQGRESQIPGFSRRVSTRPDQFGVFSGRSKIGRVLGETSDALVLGDEVLTFERR